MSDMAKLMQLAQLAGLMRDQRLETLRQALQRQAATEAHLAALEVPSPCDLSPISAGQAELAYQRWAEMRRRALRAQFVQLKAESAAARASAVKAFGKARVLDELRAARSERRR